MPKYIDLKEFREHGFLQEVNRLFFHPRGLALELVREEDGTERLGGVWDYRDDPEGIAFADDLLRSKQARAKAEHIERGRVAKLDARAALGCDPVTGIQPLCNR